MAEAPKVRIRKDLHAKIQEIVGKASKDSGLTQTAIVDDAIDMWLRKRAVEKNPVTPEQNQILNAVLEMMRDPNVCSKHLPVLKALLGLDSEGTGNTNP